MRTWAKRMAGTWCIWVKLRAASRKNGQIAAKDGRYLSSGARRLAVKRGFASCLGRKEECDSNTVEKCFWWCQLCKFKFRLSGWDTMRVDLHLSDDPPNTSCKSLPNPWFWLVQSPSFCHGFPWRLHPRARPSSLQEDRSDRWNSSYRPPEHAVPRMKHVQVFRKETLALPSNNLT